MPAKAKISGSVVAGFPSPAEQYLEPPLDLNELLVKRPAATFFARVVANYWRLRMYTAANPLPPENVRKLAEVLTESGEPMSKCCRELFLRPELTEADLRKLYPRVLKKLAEEGEWRDEGWRYAGALIKNPNFPSDLARASYDEPLLTELRVVYIFHHVRSRDLPKGELQKFEQECDGLRRDCRDGKISIKKSNARRFKLTKKYLPDECPEDWVKSIP